MKKADIKKLDNLWSAKVKELADERCEYCLKDDAWLNSCHIIGRRYRATRWLIANGMCLCFICHRQYDEHGPLHKDIMEKVVTYARFTELSKLAKQNVAKYQDYKTIKKELEDGERTRSN